jgi:hypothetical protein
VRNDINIIQLQQCDRYSQLSTQSKNLLDALVSNKDVFAEHIESHMTTSTELHESTVAQIIGHQESLPDKIAEAFEKSILENTQSISFEGHKAKHKEKVDRVLLRRLKFATMGDRYYSVADSHKKTFEWIFRNPKTWNKPWSDFSHWLSQGQDIYWISGKAGSGKSTLMRYLVESAKTKELLEQWAGGEKLTVAAFFFWNGGASEQASQTGLLRSLLYRILSKTRIAYPDLIRRVFPDEWVDAQEGLLSKRRLMRSEEQFSLGRLQKAFRFLAKQDIGRTCLLIDGLDEYDGDAVDTIRLFRQISSANIKLCLSSRPWVVFEEAFGQRPKLRLQDLTFVDVKIYVIDNLFSNRRMKALYATDPGEASQLVEEIVMKASGVFLWVMLVVRDLLKGLTNHDKIPALQQRIRALPSELRELYTTMLGQIEPRYLQESSRILQMMSLCRRLAKDASVHQQLCSTQSLCALGLSFVMEGENPLPEVQCLDFLTPKEVSERVFEVDCRLKVCCSGLLEVSSLDQAYFKHQQSQDGVVLQSYGNTHIQYLHRTVKDFVESPEMQDVFRRYTEGTRFDPYASLLTSSVFRVRKCIHPRSGVANWLTNIVEWCMMLAREHEMKTGRCEVEVLDELDRATSLIWDQIKEWSANKTISSRVLTAYSISSFEWQDDFLSLATVYDLSMYLDARLGSAKQPQRAVTYPQYLEYAIGKSPITMPDVERVPDARTIKVLLQHGANPIQPWANSTLLEKVLDKVRLLKDNEDPALQWVPTLELLLMHGYHRWTELSSEVPSAQSRRIRQVITGVYSKNLPDIANKLLDILETLELEEEQTRQEALKLAVEQSHYLSWLTRLKYLTLTW